LEELADGYSLKLVDIDLDSDSRVEISEVEAKSAMPQTYIYKFCGNGQQPAGSDAEVQRDDADGHYYKYTTEGSLSNNGGFWVSSDRIDLESNYPLSIYTDTSSFKAGSTYETDGTYDVKVEDIDAIECEDIIQVLK
jgi:hypothetical protein